MTDIRRVGDSGVHTVEGAVAGPRAARLTKQRDKEAASYEAEKNKIKEQNSAAVGRIDDKFNAVTDVVENEFRRRTVVRRGAAMHALPRNSQHIHYPRTLPTCPPIYSSS